MHPARLQNLAESQIGTDRSAVRDVVKQLNSGWRKAICDSGEMARQPTSTTATPSPSDYLADGLLLDLRTGLRTDLRGGDGAVRFQ